MSSLAWDKDLRAVLRSQAASGPFPSDESHQAASAGDETMTQARSSLSPRISLSIERQTSSGGASGAEAHTQGLQTATRRSAVGALRGKLAWLMIQISEQSGLRRKYMPFEASCLAWAEG